MFPSLDYLVEATQELWMLSIAGKRALIIDDDQRSIAVLRKMLDQMLVKSTAIDDSRNIEARLQDVDHPDVIFLDLEMPGTNGYAVLKMLQNNFRFMNVPVVACTVHISQMNKGKAAGFHSFLGKPLDSRSFPDQLKRILSGNPVWEAL